MTELTIQEMEEILYRHETCEVSGDIEATMETVVDNPHYEFPSAGWAADGADAVREHYRRSLPSGEKYQIASKKRVHGAGPNTLFREASVSFDTPEGERLTGQYLAVIEFDPETRKIKSERLYSDSVFDKFQNPHLGPDYGETPGVSPLGAMVAPITREDMMNEARGGATAS